MKENFKLKFYLEDLGNKYLFTIVSNIFIPVDLAISYNNMIKRKQLLTTLPFFKKSINSYVTLSISFELVRTTDKQLLIEDLIDFLTNELTNVLLNYTKKQYNINKISVNTILIDILLKYHQSSSYIPRILYKYIIQLQTRLILPRLINNKKELLYVFDTNIILKDIFLYEKEVVKSIRKYSSGYLDIYYKYIELCKFS